MASELLQEQLENNASDANENATNFIADADVGKAAVHCIPVSGLFGRFALHTDHKSALAAWSVPRRLTIFSC